MPISADWIEFTATNIKALSLDDAGVYEIGKKVGNVVLYIGKSTSSIRSRVLKRRAETAFAKCTHFRFRRTDDADAAEKRLMQAYIKKFGKLPPLNKAMASGDWRDKVFGY